MRALAVSLLDMQIETSTLRERVHKIFSQRRIEGSDAHVVEFDHVNEVRTIGNVDCNLDLGLRHRKHTGTKASDARRTSQRFTEGLA